MAERDLLTSSLAVTGSRALTPPQRIRSIAAACAPPARTPPTDPVASGTPPVPSYPLPLGAAPLPAGGLVPAPPCAALRPSALAALASCLPPHQLAPPRPLCAFLSPSRSGVRLTPPCCSTI